MQIMLKMLPAVVVLVLQVLVASAENPLLCVKLQPLHNVTLQQGSWVLLSMFEFVDGIASPSEPERSEECNWYLYGNVSGNSMTEYMEQRSPDNWEEEPESFQTGLYVQEGKNGRWIFNVSSSKHLQVDASEEDEDVEMIDDMLIVMASPDYFVAASCDSLTAPVPDHERFVNLVSVLGRRENNKSVIREERLLEIENDVTKTLGFTMVPHVQQRTDC